MFPSGSNLSRATIDTNHASSALSYPHHVTALEVCDLVYGASPPSWEAIEHFYEPNAKYENPLVTATSRDVIADIHSLANHLSQVDVPRPTALLYSLLGFKNERGWGDPWFKAATVWNEMSDISESESFDGRRRTIVEHSIHILFLPGLHSRSHSGTAMSGPLSSPASEFSVSIPLPNTAIPHQSSTQANINRFSGTSGSSSLLHFQLPIITRLDFSDAGRITDHRDFWDIKDVLNLFPGMSLAQWLGTRLVAQGIRGAFGASRALARLSWGAGAQDEQNEQAAKQAPREGQLLSPAAAYARTIKTTTSHSQLDPYTPGFSGR